MLKTKNQQKTEKMPEKTQKNKKVLSNQEKKHIEKHVEKHVETQLNKNLRKKVDKELSKNLPKHLDKHLISKEDYYASQVREHTVTAIIAAFSFLIALVWKDFFVEIITEIMYTLVYPNNIHLTNLYSAVIVTIIGVLGIITMVKLIQKPSVLISEGRVSK